MCKTFVLVAFKLLGLYLCGKLRANITHFPQEMVNVTPKLFNCSTCNYKTPRKFDLTRHMKTCTVKKIPKIHKCQWCAFESRQSFNIKRHMQSCKKNPTNQNLKQDMIHKSNTNKKTKHCCKCY